ncbi:hypothetical protein PR202_ga18525 [Eleusine coracana subsp. coracana]|uniref:poly(A)-specific ribonuclease n=1 Tax=Eleusine coracana subsp. coracana TaxID=191504 RepID=A0AAV5CTS4_ELECO|nr:hypothetical protein QOZ80_4AG0298830 [Eleusine coracana subsp. coracana]GJN01272.1 hypothetical protein PR202_ga18525 [Eleusine coracana subsp. coracana]
MPCPPEVRSSTTTRSGSWRRKKASAGPRRQQKQGVEIRQVWAENVDQEFKLIRAAMEHFPYVSMDTEFPGVIHLPSKHHGALTADERYALVKANVDALHLIQVGLTFAASPSSPPALAFEINLSDFDPRVHRHAPESVALLAANGVDLAAHRARGVPASALSALMMSSGLVCNHNHGGAVVTWVTFHSAYDFAYLLKLLMGRKLPSSMADFLRYVRVFFGDNVYDVKHMMRFCGDLYGGLDRVAATLGVQRAAGRSHQAGSDSVLTWDTFRKMKQIYFPKSVITPFAGVLFGLELPAPAHQHIIKHMPAAAAVDNHNNKKLVVRIARPPHAIAAAPRIAALPMYS